MKRVKDRIAGSLSIKIFLLTAVLLILISLFTYFCIVKFLPVTYQNELEENLQKVSEELRAELERYQTVEEAQNLLELFAANNQASVTLLDAAGTIVFPAEEAGTAYETYVDEDGVIVQSVWHGKVTDEEDSCEENMREESGSEVATESWNTENKANSLESQRNTEADEMVSGENASMADETSTADKVSITNEESEDMEAVMGDTLWVEGSDAEFYAGKKWYHVTIGGKEYTMLVTGTMQAVRQTVQILKEMLPAILLLIFALAFCCAVIASFYLAHPVLELARASRKMADLEFDVRCKEKRKDEIGVLAGSLNELSGNLSAALEKLQEANRQLRTDMEREREEERKRTAFFVAASHELKTPVTILKGHIGGMLGKVGAYRDRDFYLKRSFEVTETMEKMVKEILTVSKMESGTWEVRKESVDLPELVRCEVAELVELLEEKKMRLQIDLPEHLFRMADRSMMEKVFRNLLVNALRYSPAGEEIRIFMTGQGEHVLFYIENTGIKIPEESLPHLFEPFYRVEHSRNRASGGSGLGLYIVKMILEQHGGSCAAENGRDGVRVMGRM